LASGWMGRDARRRSSGRGATHQVAQLRQQWLVDTDWWSEAGRIWRAYAVMTTDTGMLCVVYQDLISEAWFLAKVYD
jgi:hypothetical protein